MRCDEHVPPDALAPRSELEYRAQCNAPYSLASYSSLSSSSASSNSTWSDAVSQKSDDTSLTVPSELDSCDSYHRSLRRVQTYDFGSAAEQRTELPSQHLLHVEIPVPPELRQNPRRSNSCSTARTGCPPSLVRQADRKVNFVDNLVDSSTQIVEAIWPTSSVVCRAEASSSVLPLRTFIQETLRRSRTSYSTLQVALYYLILIKSHVPAHDFTMEQPEDCHASRALQCGRRMFLAALILASKYLQDRNYSARAWSKISGLATHEINQNEMAFLLAVNWKLHITNEIYHRWTDCVMKFTPSQPPSPGGAAQRIFDRQCEDFRNLVLKVTPELDNLDDLVPLSHPTATLENVSTSPRSLYSASPSERHCGFGGDSPEVTITTTPRSHITPMVMEPAPATVYTPGRLAPALGLLPTPRLTPQSSGFSTPAVSAAGSLLRSAPSMSLAMAQASCASTTTYAPWAAPMTSSPQSYFTARRSSLANTISTASSPESMVSDISRASRSSSISSASSLASAPSTKLDVQARCRYAKQCSERLSMRPTIASVPEDYEENCVSSSPESYTGPVGKDLCAMTMETPVARRAGEMDDDAAARALQELHNYHVVDVTSQKLQLPSLGPRIGSKRSRPQSIDISLQDNVRELLRQQSQQQPATDAARQGAWTDSLVRPRYGPATSEPLTVRGSAARSDSRKRVCCSTEAAQQFTMSSLHPAVGGIGGPGMWEGILN